MLLSALSWGRLCGDPVHNEVRPDVGAAIYSSVSPKEGHRLTRSHQRPDVSGAGHRSSSVLFLPSVGSDPQRRSFYPATRSPTFCLYILSLYSVSIFCLYILSLYSVSQAISSPKAPDN